MKFAAKFIVALGVTSSALALEPWVIDQATSDAMLAQDVVLMAEDSSRTLNADSHMHLNGGAVTSTGCTTFPTGVSCSTTGSSNYNDVSLLKYSSTTGLFSGSMTTNGCNDKARPSGPTSTASCIKQTIPSVTGSSRPAAVPLLGAAALTLTGGVNIYSAFEAGFNDCKNSPSTNAPCACTGASCTAGLDVLTCQAHLLKTCTDGFSSSLLDSCGGHANPYHMHFDPGSCQYSTDTGSGHSTVFGVGLDGYVSCFGFETA